MLILTSRLESKDNTYFYTQNIIFYLLENVELVDMKKITNKTKKSQILMVFLVTILVLFNCAKLPTSFL